MTWKLVAVALTVAALGLAACGDGTNEASGGGRTATAEAVGTPTVLPGPEATREAIREATEEQADRGAEQTQEAAGEATGEAEDAAEEATDEAEDAAQEATEEAGDSE